MATITIASISLPNWELDSDVELRIYALQDFVAADGSIVPAGTPSDNINESDNFFVRAACTLSGSTLAIASCQLPSTTDAQDNPAARYGAYFYTTEGQRIAGYGQFTNFFLPSAPASTAWKDIAIAQRGTL